MIKLTESIIYYEIVNQIRILYIREIDIKINKL